MAQPTSFNPNIPAQRSDNLPTSQPQLQRNFQTLFDAFFENHTSLTASVGTPGNHSIVELIEQLNPIETDVSEINIYTKEDPQTTDQVFFRYQGNGQEFQYTCYQLYSLKDQNIPNGTHKRYFTFLPGRILLYFGSLNATSIGFTVELAPPIAKNIITIAACPLGSTPDFNGNVIKLPPQDGFFKNIFFFSSSINYLVMANI